VKLAVFAESNSNLIALILLIGLEVDDFDTRMIDNITEL
jgi:hypothetical protein